MKIKMAKGKLTTPDWIMEGFDSKGDWERSKGAKGKKKKEGKIVKIKKCPKCRSHDVNVVLGGGEGKKADEWECKKCGWKGKDILGYELTEDEFMEHFDEEDK